MRAVVQRVSRARVSIEGKTVGQIGRGMLVLLGVGSGDTPQIMEKTAEKIKKLRIFEDENGKTNLSSTDIGGQVLVVSQFTLYADCTRGNRPSFIGAGDPEKAEALYQYFVERCKERFIKVQQGQFGADMQVELVNDGPFTLVLEA